MGRSGKSRSRKTDKETQSPMLKIFKDIMQRQNDDPEKRNLLEESCHEDIKKRQYSDSKSKSGDRITVDSSGSERRIKSIPHKTHEQRNLEYEQDKTQCPPFQSEKKESWWLWGDNEKAEREESFSCVTCALKKLVGSEFMCVGCLLTVFTLSVVVTFLLVFRSVPTLTADETELEKYRTNSDSERLKRKIDLMKGMRGLNLDLPERNRQHWGDSMSRPLDGLSAISEDFVFPNFQDTNNLEIDGSSAELSSVLGNNNMFEIQNSDRLREFYKKLIQTDAQINMLKKGTTDDRHHKTDDENLKSILERTKRALKVHKQININKGGITKRNTDDIERSSKEDKDKSEQVKMIKNNGDAVRKAEEIEKYRMGINNDDLAKSYKVDVDDLDERNKINGATKGIVIEKNKFLLKYKSGERKKVPKCSHAPKESKSHEKQLKHPFYKNTQRLDDLLDRFMEKGLPGILADSFGTDIISKNRCKNPNVDSVKVTNKSKSKTQTPREMNNNDIHKLSTESRIQATNTDEYDVTLRTSMLLNPKFKRLEDMSSDKYFGNRRKLMQADDVDEENLGYEDLKEVLTDDFEGHDDTENRGERSKRNEESKSQSPEAYNQNWKGPIPLYPDEINSIIKQAVISANDPRVFKTYEADARLNTKGESSELEKTEHSVGDVQYIEDYLINKYDKLAQAYSDYGLLDEKKENIQNERDEGVKTEDRRVKLSIDKGFLKGSFFDRLKKGTQSSEGIRFEVKPPGSSQSHREDNPMQLYKYIQKHIKMSHDKDDSPSVQTSTILPTHEDLELMYTPKKYEETETFENFQKIYKNNGPIFDVNKGKRSLKSIDDGGDLKDDSQDETDIFNYEDNMSEPVTKNYNNDVFNINRNILSSSHYLSKRDTKDIVVSPNNKNINHNKMTFVNKFRIHNNTIVGKENNENRLKNYSVEETLTKNETDKVNNGMSLSDFFIMMANFFNFLDGVDVKDNIISTIISSTKSDETATANVTSEHTTELIYPMYDSEIIENIGHRSRVLLSIKEKNITETKLTHTNDFDFKVENINYITPNESNMATNVAVNNSIRTPSSITKQSMETIHRNVNKDNNVTELKNKNVVKRNADDINLIFWNDMYDEEYGVNIDHLENNVRDKHSAKLNNIIKSSSDWLKDKVKRLTDHIRKKTVKEITDGKQRMSEGISKSRSTTMSHNVVNKINKRDLNMVNVDIDGGKIDFAALTANMKEVCRKAAEAVQNTRNIKVREESKESAVASTLMQQLVRLMTDLVDFQVQQRTCLKLPPDLQNFLEWLTGNDKAEDMKRGFDDLDNMLTLENIANYDKKTENYLELLTPVTEKEILPLSRPDSLGCFHAVRDLIRQYEAMDEEDKSKMTGMKEYLENQLEYLQKRLNSVDYYIYQKTDIPLRFRRHLIRNIFSRKNDPKSKSNLCKYIKVSNKKYTKTTAITKNDETSLNDRDKYLELKSSTVNVQSPAKSEGNVNAHERNSDKT